MSITQSPSAREGGTAKHATRRAATHWRRSFIAIVAKCARTIHCGSVIEITGIGLLLQWSTLKATCKFRGHRRLGTFGG